MALFFDAAWFDARIAAANLSRTDVARALGINEDELTLIWKDQRELSARDVTTLAALLGATPAEIVRHAGVSTPVPQSAAGDVASALGDIRERLSRLERAVADVKALLLDLQKRS